LSINLDNYAAVGIELVGAEIVLFALKFTFAAAVQYSVGSLAKMNSKKQSNPVPRSTARNVMSNILGLGGEVLDTHISGLLQTGLSSVDGFDWPASDALKTKMLAFVGVGQPVAIASDAVELHYRSKNCGYSPQTLEATECDANVGRIQQLAPMDYCLFEANQAKDSCTGICSGWLPPLHVEPRSRCQRGRDLDLLQGSVASRISPHSKTTFCEFSVNVGHLLTRSISHSRLETIMASTRAVFVDYTQLLNALVSCVEEGGALASVMLPKTPTALMTGQPANSGLPALRIAFADFAAHMDQFTAQTSLFALRAPVDGSVVLATRRSMRLLCKLAQDCSSFSRWARSNGGVTRLAAGVPHDPMADSVMQQINLMTAELNAMNDLGNIPDARPSLELFRALAAGAQNGASSNSSVVMAALLSRAEFDPASNQRDCVGGRGRSGL
jgi:hypothetical protein